MLRILCVSSLLIVGSATCKSHKNSTSQSNEPTQTTSSKDTTALSKLTIQRFIVSFYSIGSGVEQKQIDKLWNFITEYGTKIGKEFSYHVMPWGREGEKDFCFSLEELTIRQQKDFISGVKSALQTAQWVHYSENVPCRK